MAENREPKKFEKNLGRASDLRDSRVRNAVELRKNAQDERLKKGRGMHLTHINKQPRFILTLPLQASPKHPLLSPPCNHPPC